MHVRLKQFLVILIIMANANTSLACGPREVVRSNHNTPVKDSFGKCVRTKWEARADHCAGHKPNQKAAAKAVMKDDSKIYFDFDQSTLKPSEQEKLKRMASTFKEKNIDKIKVVGYADKLGTESYNQTLSENRAQVVSKYISSLVELKSIVLDIKGLGKSNQVKDCPQIKEEEELIMCLAPNRRVEIEIDVKQAGKKK